MLARNEVIIKWTLYALATALCFLLQGALLQRITIWGVIPFLYPMLAAVPATYEAPVPATIFALCVGVVCDVLLPGSILIDGTGLPSSMHFPLTRSAT